MVDRVLRPIVQTVLAVMLALATAATVLLLGLRGTVYNEKVFRDIPDDPAFIEGMEGYVRDALEAECLFYDLPFDKVKQAVTKEWLHEMASEYTVAVYTSLCNGETVADITVDPTPYRTVLEEFFASLPDDKRPLDKNASVTLSQELADVTSSVLSSSLINSALRYGHRFVYGDTLLRRVVLATPWALVIVAVLTALCAVPWGGWRRRVYGTAGSLFVGSALAFVPLALLQWYGLTERLALGDSPLKLYVSGVVERFIQGMTTVSLWVFVAAAVLLVISIVLMVCEKKETV